MLKVWGRATSSNVQVVMWCIAELGLEYERIDRGHVHGGLDTPEFLSMNPHGMIPVVKDGDGPPLWESTAILRYLLAQYGDQELWPAAPADRATIEMWGDWIKIHVTREFTGGVFWTLVRTPAADRDQAKLDQALNYLTGTFMKVEDRLSGRPFLSGERIGYADFLLGHLLYRYYDLDIPRPDYPQLRAYYDRLTDRAPYREHVMVSYDSLRVE